ncbi:MAG TPA: 2-dehydropantoate 2-reductase N-terminal domain-containing protein, partial [Desulfosarcina sp.]|nr:2-dehydropantoate 2-reductase N-terminal domain-containing protein [Desulfosarcina sp.]
MNETVEQELRIGVVGAGSWGTALANLLGSKGYALDLWVFEPDVCRQIAKNRENKVFLPGVTLSSNVNPRDDLLKVATGKDLLLVVVPSHVMRETTTRMAPAVGPETIVVSASKGIENRTHLTMSGVIRETLPALAEDRLAVISGPSFAREVARKSPTVIT